MALRNTSLLWKLLDASLEQWIGFGAALVGVFILIWLVVRVRSRYREDEDPAGDAHEMLLQFRDLHRHGDLTDEEFRSIKSRLLGSLSADTKQRGGAVQAQQSNGSKPIP